MKCSKCGRSGQALSIMGADRICGVCFGEPLREQPTFYCFKCGEFQSPPGCQRCGPEVQEFSFSDFLVFPISPNGVTLNIDYMAMTSLSLGVGSSFYSLPAQSRKDRVVDLDKAPGDLVAPETVFFRCERWGQFAIFNKPGEIRPRRTGSWRPTYAWKGPIGEELEIPVPAASPEKASQVVVPKMPRVINLNPRRKINFSEE